MRMKRESKREMIEMDIQCENEIKKLGIEVVGKIK